MAVAMCLNCEHRAASNGKRGLCGCCHGKSEVRTRFPIWRPTVPPELQCRHCLQRKMARRKRGLCSACFADLAIRLLFPLAPPEPKPTICRHCQKAKVNRARGLCWHCYYTPGVKELFPSTSKYARRGVGRGNNVRPPAVNPTDARPGTPEKVAALEMRAKLNQALWHPADAGLD